MGLLVPARRRFEPEWMDRADNRREDLAACLADLRRINRLLGGRRALDVGLRPWIERVPPGGTIRVLDVGTGEGDHPRAIVTLARRLGRRARVVAVDRDPVIVDLARAACSRVDDIDVVEADAGALPFADDAFDVATASLFLHHFGDREAVGVLREFARVARGAVVVNDLRRHRVPWAFTAALGRLGMISPMSANDGPLSVLKGFTPDELLALGRDVHPAARVRTSLGYRLVLEVPAS